MKLQFDANQAYQLDAVAAITEIFDGQPRGVQEFSVIQMGPGEGLFSGKDQSELGIGNQLLLSPQSC